MGRGQETETGDINIQTASAAKREDEIREDVDSGRGENPGQRTQQG